MPASFLNPSFPSLLHPVNYHVLLILLPNIFQIQFPLSLPHSCQSPGKAATISWTNFSCLQTVSSFNPSPCCKTEHTFKNLIMPTPCILKIL